MSEDLQKLYNVRFSDSEKKKRDGTWIEICKYLENFGRGGVVVDIAAGFCNFINNYYYEDLTQKYAVDANPDVEKYAESDVKAICSDVENLRNYFKPGSVSMFFMSNFLEHISKEQIRNLMKTEFELLKEDGIVMILTPNIKYVKEKYWDFYDHITPITDKCIIEEAETIGFSLARNISRFLPFTTKSKLPQAQWIVRLYLKLMPFSGYFWGEQSLIILRK